MAYVERCGKVWRAHWLLADGVHYGSQSGFARMLVARRFAEDREAEIRALERVPDSAPVQVTLEGWWVRWLPAQDLAPATLESHAQQYRKHIHPRWGSTPIAEISSLQVAEFEKDLRALGLASSTVVVVMTVVRDLLTDAAAEHVISEAPAFRTGRRRRRAPDDRRPGVAVDLATVDAIRDRLPPDASLLVLVAAFTGMRWGEACGLRRSLLTLTPAEGKKSPASGWYEIDPLLGAVHEDVHSRRYFGPPKDGRGRVVDLPPFLVKRLLRHVETMGERDLLFPDTHGRPRRHTDWLYLWHPACDGRPAHVTGSGRLLGPATPPVYEDLRFQDLRHTHKTMLIELGTPDVLQDERLGHRPAGVQGVYAHSTPAMHAQLAAGLQRLWKSSTSARRAGGLALRIMAASQVRRLPVFDGSRLVGVVSQADVARSVFHDVTGALVEAISR